MFDFDAINARLKKSGSPPRFCWREFLEARAEMIMYFAEVEGKNYGEIAAVLSCDPGQVRLIHLRTKLVIDAKDGAY
jgi:hypothetical protein